MPTIKELIVKFKADLEDMERGYDAADKGAEDYAKKQEQAHQEASTSAENAGGKIEEALKKPYESVADTITKFAAKHPYAVIAAATIGLIAKEVVAWQAHKKAVEESTNALWDQSRALADAAVKAGEYGKEMAKALGQQREDTLESHTSAYASKVTDEAATRMIAHLREQASAQSAAYEQAELGKGRFSSRWSDKLNPFGAPMREKYEAESAEAKKQLDYINKRIQFYQGIKAMHAESAKAAEQAAQAEAAGEAKTLAVDTGKADRAAAVKAAQQQRQAEKEAALKERMAQQAAANAAKEAQAARDSQIKTAAARIYIQAEQTADEYDKQRLEIKAKHLETLGKLEKAGASEVEYQLATLRSQNALKAVTEAQQSAAADALKKSQEQAEEERETVLKQQAQEQAAFKKQIESELAASTKEIEANARASKDAAMSQVGFTSLRGMWQRGMEAGARERFYEPPTAENERGREQTRLQQQTRLLEGILAQLSAQSTKWDRLLAEYRS